MTKEKIKKEKTLHTLHSVHSRKLQGAITSTLTHLPSFSFFFFFKKASSFSVCTMMGSGDTSSSSDFFCRRHVFLCYKNPAVWPPRIEAAEFDRLPRYLHAAINARKPHIKKETCLTICEGHDGTETSNGDVLIFPDMIRYRRLTHFDVETFVEEVLVKEGEWLPGNPESLKASYVFVCSHGSRDRRCGVFGPILVSRFREEIELHGLQGKVLISSCSHIGGNKYAGNVIIFGSSNNREVTGHLYGYVTPDDVPLLFHQHIIKGEIFDSLWSSILQKTLARIALVLVFWSRNWVCWVRS
ncbi:altered inheritance of mitochondria protein 32 isoform X1 [Glycine max]|uniref:altered inheritance of mitochondria protein 32 isoform X1 n=1 Tax=Glycine max TaxID=3847 RepID=UPI0007192188|nr:altered inheritance of mitochondria protein 32-like isoform X1 [Glycine max]|eukprot:XP_014634932.1 altered inheritance of mitochondria protein 32-like isoform X1 [Glycine max]